MEKVAFDVRYRAVLYSALLSRLDFRFYSLMFFSCVNCCPWQIKIHSFVHSFKPAGPGANGLDFSESEAKKKQSKRHWVYEKNTLHNGVSWRQHVSSRPVFLICHLSYSEYRPICSG